MNSKTYLTAAVEHKARPPYAYPLDGGTLRVVVRAGKGLLRTVTAVYGDRYGPLEDGETVALQPAGSDADSDYFLGELTLRPPRFRYAFLLDDGTGPVWFSETGFSSTPPKTGHFVYPYINAADLYDVPDWLVDGVVYQIFPERFANGNPANDPPGVRPWRDDRPAARSFYGGDLEGIIQRLPHLEELGVTVLYLTPAFASPSNHKYDTTDYYRIDPHFGDEATLRELVQQCHARGIRVMLDAVFNHSDFDFFAFRDVRERGRESPYADWFHIHGFPVRTKPTPNYETFANGISSMPKLRTETPAVREYLLGVARYWIEACDIDGWRIDVANEVDHAFWRELRRTVRAVKPDAAVVGEIWHDALPWLLGDQFDGVTNYPLREACLDFFARGRIGADGFAQALVRNLLAYPRPALMGSWNLLGSHDTERFLTACGGDARKAALAAVFTMTWVGAPLVYYGDEIGMEGGNDPDCRRPMSWDRSRWNEPLFRLYKRLVGLRRGIPALRRGDARIVYADPATNVVAYWRGFAAGSGAVDDGQDGVGAAPSPGAADPTPGVVAGAAAGAGPLTHGGVVIVLNNSPRAREVPLGLLQRANPAGGGGEDAGLRGSATVLLDGTHGIAGGAETQTAGGTGVVRVPAYGAVLLS